MRKKEVILPGLSVLIIFIASFFSLRLFLFPQTYAETEIISVEKTPQITSKLQEMGLDLMMEWKGRIYIVAHREHADLSRLETAGIPYQLETQNFYPYNYPNNEKELSVQTSLNGDYHSYAELERDLMALEEAYPEIARLYDIGDSLEGRNIYALKISDNASFDENEAEVIFIGCHHAREWIAVEVPFFIAKYLLENYSSNPRIKEIVDSSQIWIVPLLNPDGLEYSIHFYRYWRKNRRNNKDGTYGVDLNRNYGYMWGFDNRGSSPNTFSEVYRGKAPFSEPETQAIRDLFLQRNFQALISFHSYSQVILYPWGYTKEPSAKDDLLSALAEEMSRRMESVNGRIYEFGLAGKQLYLTNGDTTDWALGVYDIPAFTIELPPVDQIHGAFFNAEEEIPLIVQENLPAALYLIEWSIQNFTSQSSSAKKKEGRLECHSVRSDLKNLKNH